MAKRLAGCVITDSENRVLLLHRNTPKLKEWELPGGKAKDGEENSDAAKREVHEELGVKVGNLALIGGTEFSGWEYSWFRAEIQEGTPHICEPHLHDALDYFDLSRPDNNSVRFSTNVYDLSRDIQSGKVQL